MAREDDPVQPDHGNPGHGNVVRGDVHGSLVQARDIGDVHVHQHSPKVHFVAPGEPVPVFGAGARVSVGERTYLVHDYLAAERPALRGAAVWRQARVSSVARTSVLGWLREVEDRDGSGAGRALAEEHTLLREHGADLPAVLQFHHEDRTTTLVVSWPRERSGRPADSLSEMLDPGPVRDRAWLARWCAGLAGLCATLAPLHDRGIAHRALSPDALVARDDGRLVLRDLGLAACAPRPGEHPGSYQAPEQRRRGPVPPGPPTDVHQVAAIAYRVVSGNSPPPAAPPLNGPHLSGPFVAGVEAALALDPTTRPGIRSLELALRDAVSHTD